MVRTTIRLILLPFILLPAWAQDTLPLLNVGHGNPTGGTPTLNSFFGKSGLDLNRSGANTGINGNIFTLEPSGSPHAVTAGSLTILSGTWPDAPLTTNSYPSNCTSPCAPTWTNNGTANTWNAAVTAGSCKDANGIDHDIFYAFNVNANTNVITETHPDKISNTDFNVSNWYNIATSSAVDGTPTCLIGQTPTNNTPPNISGTAITTTSDGDLIYVSVQDNTNGGCCDATSGTNSNWSSITLPSGCTLLQEDKYQGNLDFYCIQTTHGSFTPQATIAQVTHDTYTISAIAFKKGSGGSAPGAGASILLAAQTVSVQGNSIAEVINVGCPTTTKTLVITDDAAQVASVADSNGDTFTQVQNGAGTPSIFYKLNISIANSNTFTVTITGNAGGGRDLNTFYCTNTTSVDTGVTAGAGNTQVTNSTVANTGTCAATPSTGGALSGVPLLTPGQTNDLFILSGVMGTGPIVQVTGPSGSVLDTASPSAINACTVTTAGVCGGDANDYTNGDSAAHFYDTASSQISFNWLCNPSQSVTQIATGFH